MSELLHAYTRAQAIVDGVLIDVTNQAAEIGIQYPTALTAAVWNQYVVVPETSTWRNEFRRMWDVLWKLRSAIGLMKQASELGYIALVQNDKRVQKEQQLKAVCGAGDDGEPVITVMLSEEA